MFTASDTVQNNRFSVHVFTPVTITAAVIYNFCSRVTCPHKSFLLPDTNPIVNASLLDWNIELVKKTDCYYLIIPGQVQLTNLKGNILKYSYQFILASGEKTKISTLPANGNVEINYQAGNKVLLDFYFRYYSYIHRQAAIFIPAIVLSPQDVRPWIQKKYRFPDSG